MRCISCNRPLTDFEATRKYESTGEYVDLCNKCMPDIRKEVKVVERKDLDTHECIEPYEDTGDG